MTVVIDEAAQALEASCWVALFGGRRAVLAGDHRQLPPVVKSEAAAAAAGVTLFERLLEAAPALGARLTTQYRMHATIMSFTTATSSPPTPSPRTRSPSSTTSPPPTRRGFLVDTAGCEEDADGAAAAKGKRRPPPPATAASKSNAAEARLAAASCARSRWASVRPRSG